MAGREKCDDFFLSQFNNFSAMVLHILQWMQNEAYVVQSWI